jgi:hypothetical protein
MNRDDIIRMAREACGADMICWRDGTEMQWHELERFAALVAAAEREECAKVSEAYEPRCDSCPSGVANAIRARGSND